MKKFVNILFVSVVACVAFACSNAKEAAAKEAAAGEFRMPEFPYQEYIDSCGDDGFLVIGDDGGGFDPICNNIRYPEMPDSSSLSQFADSLLEFYNVAIAFNTMAYEVATAERYMDDSPELGPAHADALDSINVSGIHSPEIRDALAGVCRRAARLIRKGKKPNEQHGDEIGEFYEVFNAFRIPLVKAHMSDAEFNPSEVLEDYNDVHSKAISDTVGFRNELLRRVVQEPDFGKKCVLAREFAYSNHISPDRDEKELVAVIDPILRAGEYSPLLGELWLIWRTALQGYLFGGLSNDSGMYNLFYNDMRNRIAAVYIAHLDAHPRDKVAFNEFINLASEYNITRNSPCLFGNNSLLDEMAIYEVTRKNR